MVQRNTPWAPGTPCWVDFGADDFDAAKAFYQSVFGWEFSEGTPETGNYSVLSKNGRAIGGMAPKMSAGQPTAWTTYIATDNADETAEKIKAAGGQVFAEPMDVMEHGRMGFAIDPGGAFFGIWQSGTTTGFEVANEFDTPTWNENMSRDFEANKAFYGAVFGYTFEDMSSPQMTYATLNVEGNVVGGIGDLGSIAPPQTPAHWMTYFAVEDADATAEAIVNGGGSIMMPATDTAFGRIVVVSDPQGGVFSVIRNAVPENVETASQA